MRVHIDGFSKDRNYYSRRKAGDFYLSQDLTVSKMFNLFWQANRDINNVKSKINLYTQVNLQEQERDKVESDHSYHLAQVDKACIPGTSKVY
jgi:hypothetical protein